MRRLGPEWEVTGTSRSGEGGTLRFDRAYPLSPLAFDGITHVLVSVPPDEEGDLVFDIHGAGIASLKGLQWLGYLSTTGVYGTRGGDWVDESSQCRPTSARAKRRVAAEHGWLGLGAHVFRLAGIYG